MTKTILPNSFGSTLVLAVEVAWGADRSNLNTTWTWTDITADVMCANDSGITWTQGSADFQTAASAATCTFTLLNTANAYTDAATSSNWPNVVLGTPVRIRLVLSSSDHTVYEGYLSSITPGYDTSAKVATATWTASGLLKQITQGTTPAKSPLVQGVPQLTDVVGYWPMEDGVLATSFAPVVGTANAYPSAAAVFANATLSPASRPLPQFMAGGAYAELPGFTDTDQASVCALIDIPASAIITDGTVLLRLWTTSGVRIDAVIRGTSTAPSTLIKFELYLNDTQFDHLGTYNFTTLMGRAQLFQLWATYNSGSNQTTWGWNVTDKDGVNFLDSSTALTGFTIGRPRRAELIPNGTATALNAGQMWVQKTVVTVAGGGSFPLEAYNAFYQGDRIDRVLVANGWPAATHFGPSGDDQRLGRQPLGTVVDILTEAALTDGGRLVDGLGPSLTYVNRGGFENKSFMTVDFASHSVDVLKPVTDDQKLRNQVTVSKAGGSSYTYTKSTGRNGTAAVGVYPTSQQANVYSEGAFAISGSFGLKALQDRAGWLVNLGTTSGYRFPKLRLICHAEPAQLGDWFGNGAHLTGCIRIKLLNAQLLHASLPPTIDLIGVGWTFTVGQHALFIDVNCVSGDPWNVIVLGSPSGDSRDYLCHLDTGGSKLHTSVSAGATSLSIDTTAGPLWTTDSDDVPFTISIGGIPVTVTAVSGSSSPQTFTVTGATVTKALAANLAVSVYKPPVVAIGGSP